MVRIENNSHMLEITCYVPFKGFFSVYGTFSDKVVRTWFVWHETWNTSLFGICYCVESLQSKTIVICMKLRA